MLMENLISIHLSFFKTTRLGNIDIWNITIFFIEVYKSTTDWPFSISMVFIISYYGTRTCCSGTWNLFVNVVNQFLVNQMGMMIWGLPLFPGLLNSYTLYHRSYSSLIARYHGTTNLLLGACHWVPGFQPFLVREFVPQGNLEAGNIGCMNHE